MKQEDKELLLKDLCSRLPYGVKLLYNSNSIAKIKDRIEILRGITIGYTIWFETNYIHSEYDSTSGSYEHFKPYLRPMNSMTKEERHELQEILGKDVEIIDDFIRIVDSSRKRFSFLELQAVFNWLNSNHFDYLGLIPKGLAIEAPEDMYNLI